MKCLSVPIILFILVTSPSFAQIPIDNLESSEYLDFWIGEWELTWEDQNSETGKGTNRVEYILNGKVIKENFEAVQGQLEGYIGKSYSVYNESNDQWNQTWVDNQGAYLDFIGKVEGEKRIFIREQINLEGDTVLQRMVFYDIKKDSFYWNWEKSTDYGKSWQLQWKIAYRRHY